MPNKIKIDNHIFVKILPEIYILKNMIFLLIKPFFQLFFNTKKINQETALNCLAK